MLLLFLFCTAHETNLQSVTYLMLALIMSFGVKIFVMGVSLYYESQL